MRLFGLIGGLAPASTAEYYQTINTEVRRRLGGQHTATLLIWSCDQQEYIVRRQPATVAAACSTSHTQLLKAEPKG
jgi:aspartate racemase